MLQSKTVRWSAAAAVAAAVVLAIGFWPGKPGRGSSNGIAWGDVVGASARPDDGLLGRPRHLPAQVQVFLEGDRCRLEQYAAGVRRPTRIEVSPAVSTGWDSIAWSPSRKRTWPRTPQGVNPRILENRKRCLWWNNLQKIGADQTRRAGWRNSTVCRRSSSKHPHRSFSDGQPPAFEEQGTLRVWVSKRSGVPIPMELRHGGGSGNEVVETASEIQWDVPLSNELFGATLR